MQIDYDGRHPNTCMLSVSKKRSGSSIYRMKPQRSFCARFTRQTLRRHFPVNSLRTSRYFSLVFLTTSSGSVGRRRFLVPGERKQVIPDELLVIALLHNSFPVVAFRPEAGGVGCEHFIDQDDLIVIYPEFEFGIGYDDAFGFCNFTCFRYTPQERRT